MASLLAKEPLTLTGRKRGMSCARFIEYWTGCAATIAKVGKGAKDGWRSYRSSRLVNPRPRW